MARIAPATGSDTVQSPPVHLLSVRGAAEHNLKGIDVDLPRNALVVVTGVSGSGKSSLAFDTIFREAERRYLETFSSYARQFLGKMARPAARSLDGLSPAIAVNQRSAARQPRSTVGTLSGIHDDLRLLYARLGSRSPDGSGQGDPRPPLTRRLFSFNSPHGACPACRGLGVEDRLDPELLVADPRRTIRQGALVITTPTGYVIYSQVTIDVLDQVCRAHGFDVDTPWEALTDEQRRIVLCGSDRIRIPYGKHPLESRLRWSGITARPREEGTYKGILPVMEQILKRSRNRNILRFVRSLPCRACGGTRLRPEALAVTFRGRHIGEMARLSIAEAAAFFESLSFEPRETPVGEPIRAAVLERARLLGRLGVGHLALERASTSLSGGEAQRLRLASQLGSGLHGLLYVLDEPSIGLHAVEHARLLDVLRELRDRGNTVLVVEHDEDTIRQADWVVDIGPGAGQHGGELLYSGPPGGLTVDPAPPRLAQAASANGGARGAGLRDSRTAAFLSGRERPPVPAARRVGRGVLRLSNAARHNLQHLDVGFLLGALNVITGVSGAGKSSLVEELVERLGRGGAEAGSAVGKVIAVDQSPIGRTPRSNPATYTGLSDVVRDLFASTPAAVARGFGKGRFSFNVAGGRCEACQGAGVQSVGLHFLGAVDVVCGTCGGKRFNDETLEVEYRGKNIHDVLDMTLEQAASWLAGDRRAARILGVLRDLGLGYLRLGQPSTTLSGGEAQRIKLAAELGRPGRGHTLYVLDEPTTGLHVADVAVLAAALQRLVDQGHTVVVIEHHLDLVRCADRVIDLGPGGGAQGGRLVACGTPEEVAAHPDSATGAALRRQERVVDGGQLASGTRASRAPSPQPPAPFRDLVLTGVTTHNLASIDVTIPGHSVTVVTGLSGSGKSSLAFDTIFSEGRNRFIESFSAYARRFLDKRGDAEFDSISGLTPTVAIRQRTASRNPRSTVGTMTEIADSWRLLFARIGKSRGPLEAGGGHPAAGSLLSSAFSPNHEQGACPSCKGLGTRTECDPDRLVTDPSKPLTGGALDGTRTGRFYGDPSGQHAAILRAAGAALGLDFDAPWNGLDDGRRRVAMHGAGERVFDVEWRYKRGSRTGVHRFRRSWLGFAGYVNEEYERKHADRRGEAMEGLMRRVPCAVCRGTRLKPERLAVLVAGRHIATWMAMSVDEGLEALRAIESNAEAAGLDPRDALVSRDLRGEIAGRLQRLRDAGLGYLSLDRPASTLSAGEAQRVRLAAEIASGLTGTTYVLDEPTAGLHPRDTRRLLELVRALRDAGNTVIVVEHDPDVVRAADHVIDLGPGAGELGGRVVAAGTPEAVARVEASPTGRYLRRASSHHAGAPREPRRLGPGVRVRGATRHNLRALDVELPAGGLVAVTGVSGSGKSTLVFDVIAPAFTGADPDSGTGSRPVPGHPAAPAQTTVSLLHPFSRLVSVKGGLRAGGASSTVATLTGAFDRIRALFAETAEARRRGLAKRDFSTTAKGGRCEACEGQGRIRVSMDFLPDVVMPCEECGGRRYGPDALACLLGGRSIADVLELTVAEARDALHDVDLARRLAPFDELGLGYLRLGQVGSTLSGGERQRLQLAAELVDAAVGPTLFLFDEPTTGLHLDDVARLLRVFDRLIAAGHTVVCVEHHLDVIGAADWVIDLGPEGGPGGGRVVAAGTPREVAGVERSWTGQALRGRSSGPLIH